MTSIINTKILATILLGLVFMLDIFIPPGTAIAAFYLIPLSFVIYQSKKTIILFAIICCTLTVADTIFGTLFNNQFQFQLTIDQSVILDRTMILVGIVLLTFISLQFNKMKQLRDEKKETLIKSMQEMLFMTSHKVRQPITQILGVSILLNSMTISQEEVAKIVECMKDSVVNLDSFTRELTEYMHNLAKKETE